MLHIVSKNKLKRLLLDMKMSCESTLRQSDEEMHELLQEAEYSNINMCWKYNKYSNYVY